MVDYLKNYNKDTYDASKKGTASYPGPVWNDTIIQMPSLPNDHLAIKAFWDTIHMTSELEVPETVETADAKKILNLHSVLQEQIKDGLWWGVESSEFLNPNMPFWVVFKKPPSAVTSAKNPGFFTKRRSVYNLMPK